jgi:chemotaxis protein MotB
MIDYNDPKVCKIGHPAPPWLINYADLMTEMVCFFIILYALSAALNKNVQNAKKVIEEIMQDQKLAGEVKMNKEGLQITFEEQGNMAFFESGKAEISAPMILILDKLTPTLSQLSQKYDITIEGHTDNVPINSPQFPSNWELSTARATNVVKYLIQNKSFSPARLAAIGYGEYKPVALNDNEQNKAKNRRVVFFVKTSSGKFQEEKKQ